MTVIKVILTSETKISSTFITKLIKKAAERDDLKDDLKLKVKVFMKTLICHEIKCKNHDN